VCEGRGKVPLRGFHERRGEKTFHRYLKLAGFGDENTQKKEDERAVVGEFDGWTDKSAFAPSDAGVSPVISRERERKRQIKPTFSKSRK
jgi:hypothetical protein